MEVLEKVKDEPHDPLAFEFPATSESYKCDRGFAIKALFPPHGVYLSSDDPENGTPGLIMSIEVKEETIEVGYTSSPADGNAERCTRNCSSQECKNTCTKRPRSFNANFHGYDVEHADPVADRDTLLIRHEDAKEVGKYHRCGDCGRTFARLGNLRRHSREHINWKPCRCGSCGKMFITQIMLFRHRQMRICQRSYQCEECGKTFRVKSILMRHLQVHTGKKPFTCELCKRMFADRSYFRLHMRKHTGEKPYKCDHCEKQFTCKAYLIHHRRIHTGEKPYICEHCGKRFSQQGSLGRHARLHNSEAREASALREDAGQ